MIVIDRQKPEIDKLENFQVTSNETLLDRMIELGYSEDQAKKALGFKWKMRKGQWKEVADKRIKRRKRGD